ncbi:MAG: dienelactone hydrolase family protein [Acidimicrobiia bacterium]
MRYLEILLLALSALWFILPGFTSIRGWRQGLGFLVAVSVPWQLALEGYRWQMVPGYVLAVLIGIYTWWDFIGPPVELRPEIPGRRIGRALAGLVGIVALALPIVLPVPRLPTPGGSFAVGTFSLHLVDDAREETYGPNPGGPRELMVQFFYPAEPGQDAETGPWIEDLDAVGVQLAKYVEVPSFAFDHLGLTDTHTYPDAPVSEASASYPVVIYSHGWQGFRTVNFNQAEALASEGYVVVTIDHTYASTMTVFPGGREAAVDPNALPDEDVVGPKRFLEAGRRLNEVMTADLDFVVDELAEINRGRRSTTLAQRLDMDRVGLFGHSEGGGAVVSFCATDRRCKAGIGFDPWVEPVDPEIIARGLQVPFGFVRSEQWTNHDNEPPLRELFDNGGPDQYWHAISGTEHRDFVFVPLLSPVGGLLGIQGSIDSGRLVDLLDNHLAGFFGQYLMGQDTGFPDSTVLEFEELIAAPASP